MLTLGRVMTLHRANMLAEPNGGHLPDTMRNLSLQCRLHLPVNRYPARDAGAGHITLLNQPNTTGAGEYL